MKILTRVGNKSYIDDVPNQPRRRRTGTLLQRRHIVSRGRSRGWLAFFPVLQEEREHIELPCTEGARQGHTGPICTNFLEGRYLTKDGHQRVPHPSQRAAHRTTVIEEAVSARHGSQMSFLCGVSYEESVQTNAINATMQTVK